ncbi:response regulator [Massilia sp. CF038]|uniref:hybrid sensor histidine kinase/response regulator n=1 Tax=Massilia sp. CF038 TaxID=1881045 RepID=UPI00091B1B6E|nr:response regulator [Massilia sp. CF038]SHG62468.1 His Kinase A (phospho-acceptor) domain-containing protein [Massilia sp. CF038]
MMPDVPHPLDDGGDILVVEDTPASLRLLTSLLEKAGYRVREAPDGELALWSAKARSPELILLDVRMPGMDGYQVCRALKQHAALRDVPVIFLSAFDDTDDKLRGFESGGVDFISKPYNFLEVKARVAAQLKLARLQKLLAWQNDNLQQLVETKAGELARAELALMSERQQRDLAEREAQQRLAEIAHMNRNASASVCSAALVHELNQPLAAILSNAEAAELFLRMTPPPLDEVAEILADIRRDDLRASDLIQRMRATLRKSDAVAVELDLGTLVGATVDLLAAEARGRQITLQHEHTALALPVAADPVQLQQVMVNLLLNGMDAMQHSAPPRVLHIGASLLGTQEVQVQVRDHGCGFGGNHERAFESFYSTKPNGMGLGLSISHGIITAAGGQAWASDHPDGGAVVSFSLPLLTAHP